MAVLYDLNHKEKMNKSVSIRAKACLLAACACVAGCMTIRNARDAQGEYEALSRDDYAFSGTNRLDLTNYSLAQLVDFAMTNRPSIAHRALALEDARLALKQLRADAPLISETPWLSPKISVSGDYSGVSESAKFDELSLKTERSVGAAVNISIPIYDFGRNDAKVRAGCEKVLDAELQLVDEGYTVFYDVCTAYFALLEESALLAVAQSNECEYAMHLKQAEQRLDAGEANQLDVSRSRLDLARSKEKVVIAALDLETAGADFKRALGVDSSYGDWNDIIKFPGDPLSFVMRGFPDTNFTVEEAFELARTNSPTMRVCRSRLRAASADVDYAIADLMPEISASVSLNWTDPAWYWHWGVSAVQSVFQGFRKTTAVDRAVVALRQAAKDVDTAELELSLALEKSVAARDTALKSRETALVSLKEARDNLDLVNEQYKIGDATQVEYTDAVSYYAEALGNCVIAFYLKQSAEAAIFSLVGIYPVYDEMKLMEEHK